MKTILFLLTFVIGAISTTVSIQRPIAHKYHLIKNAVTWSVAQNYCRTMYEDIATVASSDDLARLVTVAKALPVGTPAWLGLYNDFDTWRFSYKDLPLKNITLRKWAYSEPLNTGGKEACGVLDIYGYWWDWPCVAPLPFVCYNGNYTGAKRFIGVYYPYLDWFAAQSYCRLHHTDLASATTELENSQIQQVVYTQGNSWFGLFRDTWKWADGTNFSITEWISGLPDNYWGQEDCGILYYERYADERCSNQYYFFCHTTPPPVEQQILKLQLEFDDNVFDPTVQESILELVKQKLEEHGMLANTTVTWRLQQDGSIFRKKSNGNP